MQVGLNNMKSNLRMHAAIHMFARIWHIFQPAQQTMRCGLHASAQAVQSCWTRMHLQTLRRWQVCKRRFEFRPDCGEITCRSRFDPACAHASLRMTDILEASHQ